MRVRRDELTIMRDFLRLMREPATSTEILSGANLSYTQFRRYPDFLVEKGFLKVAGRNPPTYSTTSKGNLFLRLVSG